MNPSNQSAGFFLYVWSKWIDVHLLVLFCIGRSVPWNHPAAAAENVKKKNLQEYIIDLWLCVVVYDRKHQQMRKT
jgi:hypothetical protein